MIGYVNKGYKCGERTFLHLIVLLVIAHVVVTFQSVIAADQPADAIRDKSSTSETGEEKNTMKWISSVNILEKHNFVDLSTVDQKEYKHVWSSNLISHDAGWKLHKGDVIIEGSLDNDHLLLVDGNLTIKGTYNDYRNGSGHLVVLGNFNAENVLSNNDIYVSGRLTVKDLIYTYYNDFAFSVDRGVYGRGLIVDDKSGGYNADGVGFEIHTYHDSVEQLVLALQSTVPEIWLNPNFAEEGIEAIYYMCEDNSGGNPPDLRMISSLIEAGQPVFREKQAPPDLIEKICEAMSPELSEASLLGLMAYDPLVQYALATRTDLKERLYKIIERSENPTTRAILLTHRKVNETIDVSKLSVHEAMALADREDISDENKTQLAHMGDIQVLEKLSLQDDLPVAVLVELVSKNNDSLTIRTLGIRDNAFRLPLDNKENVVKKYK